MIEGYLKNSKQLKQVFLLIDIRHEPGKNDVTMYDWIVHQGYEPVIIATKADKIKPRQIQAQVKLIRNTLGMKADGRIIPFSSLTKSGRDEIYAVMENYLQVEG